MAAVITLLVLIFLVTSCSAFMVAWSFFRSFGKMLEDKRDDAVEAAEANTDRFNQGIENILSFSVKGMTGFDEVDRK